jgi:hypothetical protein
MAMPCTVVIGAPEVLDALRESAGADGEVLSFTDSEPLDAVEAITSRRPAVLVIERLFAATSRGAALINRIKADPALDGVEIRIASVDGTYRISARRTPAPPGGAESTGTRDPIIAQLENIADETEPGGAGAAPDALDFRGTRRAPRYRLVEGTEAQIDGALATIVDLSTHGAQIVCSTPLKPQQKLRMILADDLGVVKFGASVAWAFFEIPKGVSRYRAGVEFKDADKKAVAAFCRRHMPKQR